jgi:hypothetical protein
LLGVNNLTIKEFEQIEKKLGFNQAMDLLSQEKNCITTYDVLKDYAIHCLHIINNIKNSYGTDFFYYDYCSGTTMTPICLNSKEDILFLLQK